ncbi:flagellar biosynthesis regulator FlaF [Xinfangfangia sp. D13-10-4-6]|uniref:flagellar biosynthesis regulator FlaF n=1 Tax=Pseudogemmobacter hezensis TaxID=2737662 RepID=UPI0015549904|nr:flagellar biosynthesis regulator FlaF [Pseudogemmobacter hezensis]NPD17514.1 flagellar biosynthesis regulator FlaF [Pseudogemmobacter hezensis]
MTLSSNLVYAQPSAPIRTARMAEYDIIARVTQRLVAAQNGRNEDRTELLEAVFNNEKLWSTLAADVAEPTNGLPAMLRARLLYLYRFTVAHSRKIRDNAADAAVLIEVNKAILKGLRGQEAVT